MLLGNVTLVGSTKDLNPESEIDFKRIKPLTAQEHRQHPMKNTRCSVPTKECQHYM